MPEPMTGRHLELLPSRLDMTVLDLCYLLGISMNRWGRFIHEDADTPLSNPSVAILARHYLSRPGQVPRLGGVNPEAVYARIREIDPGYSLRRFALLLGLEAASGHRWVRRGGGTSLPVERLLYWLQEGIFGMSPAAALREFEHRATLEAKARGIPDLWEAGNWSPPEGAARNMPGENPMAGERIQHLRMQLGLDADAMRYLLGLSMNAWGKIVNAIEQDSLPRPTVSLLARYYQDYPEMIRLPTGIMPRDVFEKVREIDPHYTLKRFGLILGSDASAGYRWIKRGSQASATVDRLLYYLAQELAREGRDALQSFEMYAREEARSRGITDLWHVQGWNPTS